MTSGGGGGGGVWRRLDRLTISCEKYKQRGGMMGGWEADRQDQLARVGRRGGVVCCAL